MRRRDRKARGQSLLGAALIVVVAGVLGAFAYAGIALRPPPTDPETLCRSDRPIAAHTIILIDSTDRLETRHRRKLEAVAAQERARLGRFDRLTLMRLNTRRPQEPAILFSKCLPLPPEDANPFVQNPRMAQEAWDADFADALAAALRSAQSGGPNRASPILAALRAAAADPDFGLEIATRRLVLVSDFLEHTPGGFSHYAASADYAAWRRDAAAAPADLARVSVRLVPIDRPDHAARQAAAMDDFWPAYFDATHAASVDIDPAP
ncbi:MAG: hypothetical protein AB7P07_12110 [Hyphomonadaceae bacterium]